MTKRQNAAGHTYRLVGRLLSLVGISDMSSLLCEKDPELK
jgi:hypothetical protein